MGFTPVPDCEPQEAVCPAQVMLYFLHPSTPQSPEAGSHFPLSPQTPNILPLPALSHQHLPTLDCPSCHPQPVPPNRCKGPAPTTLLSLCHIISLHSFILLDLLQLYTTMLLPLPAEKNKRKHPSVTNIEKRLVDSAGKERVGPAETVALKHIHYHMQGASLRAQLVKNPPAV